MPTFNTPEPISVTVDVSAGDLSFLASDRLDTVVTVSPRRQGRSADAKAAEQTQVSFADGTLRLQTPKVWKYSPFGSNGLVDITVELPSGSRVRGECASGGFHGQGRLGECRMKLGAGDIRLERVADLDAQTGAGNVTVDHISGTTDVSTGTGDIRIRRADGDVVLKNTNGSTLVEEVFGDLRAKGAHGQISVDSAHSSVEIKTSHGAVRIGEVMRGSVLLESSYGALDIGIREGTAAWLDVRSERGRVRNQLEAHAAPDPTDETVEVRARTTWGDITVAR
ncbi:DUF4097 family beta strand repeat-containing protein [Okibacterium endophyticum]